MPAPSWFQKLRRRRKKKTQSPCRGQEPADGSAWSSVSSAKNDCSSRQCRAPSSEPAACAASPNRTSYYVPSEDRARQDGGRRLRRVVAWRDDADAASALDVRVDVVHRAAGGRRRLGGLDAPPGTPKLELRPLVTRHNASDDGVSSAITSAATTPSTRARGFHVKPAGVRSHHHQQQRRRRRRDHDSGAWKDQEAAAEAASSPSQQHGGTRRRRWLYGSLVVVKASSDPERELAESMAEMVAANGIRSSDDLEELLACYLALNAAEHHRAVVAAFRRVWFRLARHVVDQPAKSHPKP